MRIKIRDIASAGLPEPGKYRLYIESVGSDRGISEKEGQDPYEWERADVTFRILEDEHGNELKHKPFIFDSFFVNSERGLDKFLNLYQGVTGYLPEEGDIDPATGEPSVETDDLLEDIDKREVCAVVLYDTNTDNRGRYGLRTGWSYGPTFDKVSMPKKRITGDNAGT